MPAPERLPVTDPAADERFRDVARRMSLDPDHQWVGGYVDFAWQHTRPAYGPVADWIAGRRVLEVGFNVGANAVVLAALGAEVTAVEVDPGWIPLARANAERHGVADRVEFLHTPDTARLPFADARFDMVSCCSVLEYIPAGVRRPVMRELDRTLRPGGLVVVLGSSNRIWPKEMHTQRWLTNYVPRLFDRFLTRADGPVVRGVWPWEARFGFGSYRRAGLVWARSPYAGPAADGSRGLVRRARDHLWHLTNAESLLLTPGIALVMEKRSRRSTQDAEAHRATA